MTLTLETMTERNGPRHVFKIILKTENTECIIINVLIPEYLGSCRRCNVFSWSIIQVEEGSQVG